jgi:demethylmenaquinone methyltransferase/2-methoxy-6-polyprenyl-1,4-benzoquinol methylase
VTQVSGPRRPTRTRGWLGRRSRWERSAGEAEETAARSGNPVAESDVTAMFDEIAPVYDRLNTIMTAGRDGSWRRAAVRAARVGVGATALDAACGTGRVSELLAQAVGPFGLVVGVDLSAAMIAHARQSYRDVVQLRFEQASVLDLPFADAVFDAATIAFGLRNLSDFEAGVRELARVVRPNGRVVCLELTPPRPRLWGAIFRAVFRRLAPLAGRLFGVADTYRYLPASLEGFPDADELASIMARAGLVDVAYRRLGLGSVALHVGKVPPGTRPPRARP